MVLRMEKRNQSKSKRNENERTPLISCLGLSCAYLVAYRRLRRSGWAPATIVGPADRRRGGSTFGGAGSAQWMGFRTKSERTAGSAWTMGGVVMAWGCSLAYAGMAVKWGRDGGWRGVGGEFEAGNGGRRGGVGGAAGKGRDWHGGCIRGGQSGK